MKIGKLELFKNNSLVRHLKIVTYTSVIACTLGWSLYGIKQVTGWQLMSDVIAGVDQNFYLKFFYDNYNTSSEDSYPPADDRIVIVNIHDCTDEQIAGALIEISERNPAVVGVDKLFSSHIYTEKNDTLLKAVKSLGDKLVAPMYLRHTGEDGIIDEIDKVHASYCDQTMVVNIGCVHLRDYYDPMDSLDVSGELMFDYLIACKSGYLSPDVKNNISNVYINYRNKAFNEISYRYLKDEEIGNKIVLVGDLDSETEDSHILPFQAINNDNALSGLRLIAYSVNSMITPWNQNREEFAVNRAYCNDYGFVTVIISLFAILFFTIIYHLLYEFIRKLREKKKSVKHYSIIFLMYIFTSFILLAIEVYTVILGFKYTEMFFIIPNLLGLMFSYFCVSIVYSYFTYHYEDK